MNKLLVAMTTACLVLGAEHASAQGRVVTGTVTSSTGQPLAGVVVTVRGTNVRAVTDADGRYSIQVPAGADRLVFTGQSVTTSDAAISGNTVNVTLAPQAVALEGLIVTALGITQQERAVGTSVQAVRGEELTQARETNLVNALAGKAAGVTVTNAGPQGGSSRIVIRGANSISGNNQPLFVVDGVPIDNSSPRLAGYGGVDYGNAAQDINPNDVESISILKGPNAAALYGSRAANGAIVITTKKGKSATGLGITASSNVTFETPLRLPDYQNEYGQGLSGRFEYVDGNYGGVNDGVDESWGPRLDGSIRKQWFGEGPWVANPNNVRDFFETGRTLNTNVALAANADNASVRLSLNNTNVDGMYPGFGLDRTTVALSGIANLTSRFTANGSVQYINADGENRPGVGYEGDNPMQQFIWFGRQVDMRQLKEAYEQNRGKQMVNWNYSYHNNPYWIALENRNFDNRDRLIGSGSANYRFTDWLNATVRTGTDWYEDRRKRTFAAGTLGGISIGEGGIGANGAYTENIIFQQETNSEFLLSAERDLTSDFSLSANFGGNRRDVRRNSNWVEVNDLSIPYVYNLGNSAAKPYVTDNLTRRRVNSLYGQAQFGFRNFWFVDVTGRNDWSSTLPEANNSYFYPSVSTSFVFTDAFPSFGGSLLSFGKLRGGWTRVGSDADPYMLRAVYSAVDVFNGVPAFAVGNTVPNPDLRPESTEAWEVGADVRFLSDRLGIDATYYDSKTTDQIVRVPISPTSGYTTRVMNAGTMSNKGVELQLSAVPVRMDNGFEWEVIGNYARNRSRVVELAEGVESLVLGTYWSVNVEARAGQPYGTLFGKAYNRDEQGRLIIGSNGRPSAADELQVLGNYNPDWTGSISNRLSYGGLDFSFLVDTRQGGEIFSVTNMFGQYAGVLAETARGRCGGALPACTAETGLIIPGVKADGTPNDIPVSAEAYYQGLYDLHEAHILDASFTKLREVRLGYNIPSNFTRRVGVSGMNLAVVGRNLWLKTDAPHIDPETAFDASNAQGFEFGQLPTARSIGFNVVVTP
ncbi:MAG TPA: SusC/RagA family TonB-linked outer membrane protein [Longimicrobiaceae bacterium]|nr:SusC/RagA family TonB-linked outer membrane protein [Longimicrobiaceae bacterium]